MVGGFAAIRASQRDGLWVQVTGQQTSKGYQTNSLGREAWAFITSFEPIPRKTASVAIIRPLPVSRTLQDLNATHRL